MTSHRTVIAFAVSVVTALPASPALALANRVFVSARTGNNANGCDNVTTPCQTFAGAVLQLNPDGEVIVLDSGGYGPVTITQGITIEAPAGVTAFVHPPSGDAITINAPSAKVILRGLVLNGGVNNGIEVQAVGTLSVESCFITGFTNHGIHMGADGSLAVKGTDVKNCRHGIHISTASGTATLSIDHCHLDSNVFDGFFAAPHGPGASRTTATNSTANNNTVHGWVVGDGTSGLDVLNLEFCAGSGNGGSGIIGASGNASSVARYSNSVFSNNAGYGVNRASSGAFETRGNNTITGNDSGSTHGTIGSFTPM